MINLSSSHMYHLILLLSLLTLSSPLVTEAKAKGFTDPNTNYAYRVEQKNETIARVSRFKLNEFGQATGEPEPVQTIKFHPSLVDFDLHCLPTHCYLVAVTSRNKRNVELYAWQRTQFDLLVKKDSFATPIGVKIFRIGNSFYIAVAQEQYQLDPNRLKYSDEGEEPTRFIGNAIFKFTKGHEKHIKYHQYIQLPYHPTQIIYYRIIHQYPNQHNVTSHLLLFKDEKTNLETSFIWSPMNDQFWPYKIPLTATITEPSPDGRLPQPLPPIPIGGRLPTTNDTRQPNQYGPQYQPPAIYGGQIILQSEHPNVESCFYQLERLLSDRDLISRQVIENSRHIWRNNMAMTNVSARVYVNGDVIVRGSLIETPRMTILGHNYQPAHQQITQINQFVDQHSPFKVEDKVNKAFYKLQFIREKLSRAVPASINSDQIIPLNSPIRFYAPITASQVIFKNGIINSNVRINGIPFRQLQYELISLGGAQDILANVMFTGNVVADTLEIHGTVNNAYLLKDAVDITSNRIQVIETQPLQHLNAPAMEFASVSTPNLILTDNATINSIRLAEFVTRTPKPQTITGSKTFKNLSMSYLELAHPHVTINGFNISHLVSHAIPVRSMQNFLNGRQQTFMKPIKVDNLIINGLINRHINMSILLQDSVKVEERMGEVQQIIGVKRFTEGLRINHLTTEGAINDVQISEIFNLNYAPPVPDYRRFLNGTNFGPGLDPIKGRFEFLSPTVITGNLNVNLVNGIELSKHAVRRQAPGIASEAVIPMQVVTGRKIFARPMRVINQIRLANDIDLAKLPGLPQHILKTPPTINGFDIRSITSGIERQLRNPSAIFIDNLEIEGNIFLNMNRFNNTGPAISSLGNASSCPLDAIARKLVLGGGEAQQIETPIRVQTLRARAANFEPKALNGFTFPHDFILKSLPKEISFQPHIEHVYGNKNFNELLVAPAFHMPFTRANYPSIFAPNVVQSRVIFGSHARINNITRNEMQTFIAQERQRNSTGETVLQTLTVYGNLWAKTINGMSWPDDIILKGVASLPVIPPSPNLQRRIYSPLIFDSPHDLHVENHLGLRGPIELRGYLNGVNMTQFAQQSVTYGDKDLLSVAKPIRNKIFAGGLTITGEMRAQGTINGINFEEMKARVVPIRATPYGRKTFIMAPKSFSSDIYLFGPTTVVTLNNLPVYRFLKRVNQYNPAGGDIKIFGKKTISGQLKVGRMLIVDGLINGINFTQVRGNAIILGPSNNNLQFNKTLTVEGDIFVDNLYIDENNGIIDGVRLGDIMPLAVRRPISINYEPARRPPTATATINYPPVITMQNLTRKPVELMKTIEQPIKQFLTKYIDTGLIIGFIQAQFKDLSSFKLPYKNYPSVNLEILGYRQLDQIDYQFYKHIYHLRVGVSADGATQILFDPQGRNSVPQYLPVTQPKTATFMNFPHTGLYLLISEDIGDSIQQCPRYPDKQQHHNDLLTRGALSRFHVYMFHPWQNSSSLQSAYFDLYQTIDIPQVDDFKQFEYNGDYYVLASSTLTGRIYLLLERGYSGFETVSYFETVEMEKVNLMFSMDDKPFIIVYHKSGDYTLMEPVII